MAGNNNATKIPMMAITTSSSTSVKAVRFGFIRLHINQKLYVVAELARVQRSAKLSEFLRIQRRTIFILAVDYFAVRSNLNSLSSSATVAFN